ncbi:unnamed protein product [Ectocarpus sp. CCAP 1310/34]|nr:unnamed protein product [Ectocarpus sp. CCAP 1310/34]
MQITISSDESSKESPSPRRFELVNSDSEGDGACSSEDEPLFKFPDRGVPAARIWSTEDHKHCCEPPPYFTSIVQGAMLLG